MRGQRDVCSVRVEEAKGAVALKNGSTPIDNAKSGVGLARGQSTVGGGKSRLRERRGGGEKKTRKHDPEDIEVEKREGHLVLSLLFFFF